MKSRSNFSRTEIQETEEEILKAREEAMNLLDAILPDPSFLDHTSEEEKIKRDDVAKMLSSIDTLDPISFLSCICAPEGWEMK